MKQTPSTTNGWILQFGGGWQCNSFKKNLLSLNPFLFTAWSLLKNFTTLREGYASRTPSIGRRFNFLTRMAVGKYRNFQKLKLFIYSFLFSFFSGPWVLTNFAKLFKKPASTKISHFPLSLRILSNYILERTKVESSLMQNFHNSYMTSTTSMLRFVHFLSIITILLW